MRREKHTQQTTHTGETVVTPEEIITVINPRHPLFGRTFLLINIIHKPRMGSYCVVRYLDSLERSIPLSATDRSLDPPEVFEASINLASVRQLLKKYTQITSQSAEDVEDGRNQQNALDTFESDPPNHNWRAGADGSGEDLGCVDNAATTATLSTIGQHLLSPVKRGEQCPSGGGKL